MKSLPLYNTAHPLADTGKPIFIPFGEWKYDATRRQRLDRAHGERIANELNARVARGEPGIPVYQGHPDVPELASKYPDKGALGWVTKIELANESRPDGRTVSGLNLTVEWDRDPGKGFKWFSPYWFANEVERDGVTYIVSEISSIGLVNNPNIPEFRLANEAEDNENQNQERKIINREELIQMLGLPPDATDDQIKESIGELKRIADAKFDRFANSWNESDHPRDEQGQFTDKGQSEMSNDSIVRSLSDQFKKSRKSTSVVDPNTELARARSQYKGEKETQMALRKSGKKENIEWAKSYKQRKIDSMAYIRSIHKAAILSGFKYNSKTRSYE